MRTDVAIVGGGPGGAAAAVYLGRAGISSVIVEKQSFPRFHIGESLTDECGNLLREIGLGDEMSAMGNPIKHGVKVLSPAAPTASSSRSRSWCPGSACRTPSPGRCGAPTSTA